MLFGYSSCLFCLPLPVIVVIVCPILLLLTTHIAIPDNIILVDAHYSIGSIGIIVAIDMCCRCNVSSSRS